MFLFADDTTILIIDESREKLQYAIQILLLNQLMYLLRLTLVSFIQNVLINYRCRIAFEFKQIEKHCTKDFNDTVWYQ